MRALKSFSDLRPMLLRYVLKIVRDEAMAEDVMSETAIRVITKGDRVEPGGVRQWLFTVSRNAAYDALRRKRRQPESHGADMAVAPFEELLLCQLEVRKAIAQMPRESALIVLLADIEGLHHREIAVLLGRTEKAIKARRYRARRLLREIMA